MLHTRTLFGRTRLRTRLMLADRIRRVFVACRKQPRLKLRKNSRKTNRTSQPFPCLGDISCHIGQSKETSSVKIGELFVIEPQ
jgi:hypothetical protein